MAENISRFITYEGYFFQGSIGREIRTTMRIRWSFAQMCCAMSLVCQSTATNSTCQVWARSEPVNMTKTIVFRQIWSECCNSIPLFWKSLGMLSSGIVLHDSARPHTAAATKKLLKRFRWEVFDHPPSFPDLAPSVFHLFPRMKRSLEDNILVQWAADQRRQLVESTGGWLLWRGYWRVGTTLQKMSTSKRRLSREVADRCG